MEPSPVRFPPPLGAAASMRPARREKGSDWSQTLAGASQGGEEDSFTAEHHRLDPSDLLDVEVDRILERHHAARVHVQDLPGVQNPFLDTPSGMNEDQTVSFQLLQDEPFTSEQTGQDLALQMDPDRNAFGRAQETVFLAHQPASNIRETDRNDAARIGSTESDMGLPSSGVRENRDEEALTGQKAFPGAHQLVHEPAAAAAGSIAKSRFHLDGRFLVHHGAGFGNNAFARVQFNLHKLHFLTEDLVVDLMSKFAHRRCGNGDGRTRDRSGWKVQLRNLGNGEPFGETLTPDVTVGIGSSLTYGFIVIKRTGLLAVITEVPL